MVAAFGWVGTTRGGAAGDVGVGVGAGVGAGIGAGLAGDRPRPGGQLGDRTQIGDRNRVGGQLGDRATAVGSGNTTVNNVRAANVQGVSNTFAQGNRYGVNTNPYGGYGWNSGGGWNGYYGGAAWNSGWYAGSWGRSGYWNRPYGWYPTAAPLGWLPPS